MSSDHSTFFSVPKSFSYNLMLSSTILHACSWPRNSRTSTVFFSIFLQSSKKRWTCCSKCSGSSLMSVQCETDMSLAATAMILSSPSPWSSMRITPMTLASTRQSGSTLAEQMTRMSRGSWSSQQVCGMKPQLCGQWTALKRMRSSFNSPESLSSSYLTLLSAGISMMALTIWGDLAPQGTLCQGFLAKSYLCLLIVDMNYCELYIQGYIRLTYHTFLLQGGLFMDLPLKIQFKFGPLQFFEMGSLILLGFLDAMFIICHFSVKMVREQNAIFKVFYNRHINIIIPFLSQLSNNDAMVLSHHQLRINSHYPCISDIFAQLP